MVHGVALDGSHNPDTPNPSTRGARIWMSDNCANLVKRRESEVIIAPILGTGIPRLVTPTQGLGVASARTEHPLALSN